MQTGMRASGSESRDDVVRPGEVRDGRPPIAASDRTVKTAWLAGAVAGVGATLVMVAVSLLVRQLSIAPTLTEVLADGFTAFVPLGVFVTLIQALESYAKRLLFIGIIGAQLVAGLALGLLLAARLTRSAIRGDGVAWRFGALLGLGAWLGLMVVVMPLFGAGIFVSALRAGWAVALISLVEWQIFGAAAVWLFWQLGPRPTVDDLGHPLPAPQPGRRRFVVGGGLAVLAAALGGLGVRTILSAPTYGTARGPVTPEPATTTAASSQTGTIAAANPPAPAATAASEPAAAPTAVSGPSAVGKVAPPTPVAPPEYAANDVPGMTLAITPNKEFYTVSKNFIDPVVDVSRWNLQIGGLVERPLTLGYDELVALPAREQYTTLECISNEVGGELMGNAIWRGVPFRSLLELAGPKPGVRKVVLRAWDDYSDSFTFERAMNEANLLAWEMNGATLPADHGFPCRLLVPGIYGMKNVKWVTKIELVDYDYQGYWQQRGWSDDATIMTMSRIDFPPRSSVSDAEKQWLAGVAFAGNRGIQQVEVSVDGGETWRAAELRQALGPYTWVLWVYNWNAEPGTYTVRVRAVDGTGELQTERERDPIPDGATGWHTRRYRVG